MSLITFLRNCEKAEKILFDVYTNLASKAGVDTQLGRLLTQMAKDEVQHANKIGMMTRLVVTNAITVNEQPALDADAEKLVTKAEKLKNASQSNELSINDLIDMSIAIEGEFLSIHVEKVVSGFPEEIAKLLVALGREDEKHLMTLKEIRNLKD